MLNQNPQQLLGDIHLLLPLIVTNALHVLAAIIILIIGFWIAGRMQLLVAGSLNRAGHVDPMLKIFFSNSVRYFVLTIVVLAVLSQFGIQTTSLVAVVGAASLAIGLALQGTLSHLAAGVMLLIFRPFRIGHHVLVGGIDGTVKELSLFWTELVTADNVQVIIPNGGVWGQALRNFSVYPRSATTGEVRFQLPVVDTSFARERIAVIAQSIPKVQKDPPPSVLLDRNVTSNALEIVVTFVPTDGGTVASVKSDIIQAVHDALESPSAHAEERVSVTTQP
jgi:small conductance mechanosensitive channel